MVVLGKANLSEWANLRDERSTSGWSAYGGLTRNPYALNRSAGGSVVGQRRRGRGRADPLRRRHRDRRLDHLSGRLQRVRRTEADGRPGPDRRSRPDLVVTGLARPVDRDGRRGGGAARCAHRRRRRPLRAATRRGWRASGSASPARCSGATARRPTRSPSRRCPCCRPQGAVIVDETDLESMVDYSFDDELVVLLAEFRVELGRYLATRDGDGPQSHGRRGRLQPRARRHRAAVVRPVVPRAGPRRSRPGLGGVRRGPGQVPQRRAATTDRRRAARARARRVRDPVVRPGDPDRPRQRRDAPRCLHAARPRCPATRS